MIDFQTRVKTHLSAYRLDTMGIAECGSWRDRPYEHILPIEQVSDNILPSIRDQFWEWIGPQRVKLHRDFAHLNSSQAFCFNFFYPFLRSESGLKGLLHALKIDGTAASGAEFEYIPDRGEGTSFDFLLRLTSGARVLFEVKYTESDFGSAKSDQKHHAKYSELYQPRCGNRYASAYEGANAFLKHYQILRNIWHLRDMEGDVVIFLVPRSNEAIGRKLHVIRECIHQCLRDRVRVVFVEDLLREVQVSEVFDRSIQLCMNEFAEKYLPASATGGQPRLSK